MTQMAVDNASGDVLGVALMYLLPLLFFLHLKVKGPSQSTQASLYLPVISRVSS